MKTRLKKIIVYALLIAGAIIMVFPFYWMITGALKTSAEYNSFPPVWVPSNIFNFDNFKKALEMAPFARFFMNSVIITVCGVCLQTFLSILMAFTFSKLEFPGRNVIFALLLGLMMVPYEMLVITNYATISRLNMIDTYTAIFLPSAASVYYMFILKNYFESVSNSIYYSARMDGATNWKFLWRILVPLAKPALMTTVLLNTIGMWNTFLWPLIVTNVE